MGAKSSGGVHRLKTTDRNRARCFPQKFRRSTRERRRRFLGRLLKDGDLYRFYVVGTGSEGFKRDPYARELEFNGYPDCNCIVRDPGTYAWHDAGFRPPAFSDLIIYQFHIGVFFAQDSAGTDIRRHRICKILDVVDRIEYFADLGVNAVMPLRFRNIRARTASATTARTCFRLKWITRCRPPSSPHM